LGEHDAKVLLGNGANVYCPGPRSISGRISHASLV
jgi:hypothetical protein